MLFSSDSSDGPRIIVRMKLSFPLASPSLRRIVPPALLLLAAACSTPATESSKSLLVTSSAPLTVSGLFPTGVDDNRAPLAGGARDPHYFLIASDDPLLPGPDTFVVDSSGPFGAWTFNDANSQWISAQGSNSGNSGVGNFTFRTSFTLSEVDPATAKLDASWSDDNTGSIKFNGNAVASADPGFSSTASFSVTSGFVSGTNNLDFIVNNSGGPMGLRVTALSVTAHCTADTQCNAGRWCDELFNATAICEDKKANGELINGGTCTTSLAARACVSGVCSTTDNLCGIPNGVAAASAAECRSGVRHTDGLCGIPNGVTPPTANAALCRSNLLGSNGKCGLENGQGTCSAGSAVAYCQSATCDTDGNCGYANGSGPCTSGNASTVCRSGLCSAGGTCVAAGACAVDGDCTGGWCKVSTTTCAGKVPNGAALPSDSAHTTPVLDGTCTAAAAALVCASGVCDTADNLCGHADGNGPCTAANAAAVCRSGSCRATGVCGVDASGPDAGPGDAGSDAGSDAGADATLPADSAAPDSDAGSVTPAAPEVGGSLQGGGIECAAAPERSGHLAGFAAAAAALLMLAHKRTRRAA